jgi:hypothetical protein
MPRWEKILLVLVAIGAVVAFLLVGLPRLRGPDSCAAGVVHSKHECIGVNGDGYDFHTKDISDVARAIAAQNKKIGGDPSVTVAVMMPLQSQKKAARRQMRSDLLGAYLGQRQANAQEGELPKIRLVLANPGAGYGQQAKVVGTLLKMAGSSTHPLRAVTGFNLSLDTTKAAIRRLTHHGIPVLASRISSDDIANTDLPDGTTKTKYPGLARVIPTNQDAARALADFNNNAAPQDRKTIVVYDDRPHDSYNRSLKKAFTGIKEEGPPGPAAMSFTSPGIDAVGDVGNQFDSIAGKICYSHADTIYFAGRALHLRLLALELAGGTCDRHFTIISGSDAASLQQYMSRRDWKALLGTGEEPKVTVQYAAPGHPDAWGRALAAWDRRWQAENHRKPTDADRPHYLTDPRDALRGLKNQISDAEGDKVHPDLDPAPSLDDSRTMLVYDGLSTIATALHRAQHGTSGVPGAASVGREWRSFQSGGQARGTSGWICLTNAGNAYDKPVAVVELDPNPRLLQGGRLKFLGLAWPTGHPPPPNCVIPDGIR